MHDTAHGALATCSRWIRVPASARCAATMLYYLAILLALLVLQSRGEFSTTGFIYQAF
jgi:hypothetical protein